MLREKYVKKSKISFRNETVVFLAVFAGQFLQHQMLRASGVPTRWPLGQGPLKNMEGRSLTKGNAPFLTFIEEAGLTTGCN